MTSLGATPSFLEDFAHACSTAFAGGLAQTLTGSDLTKASQDFGVGGWELPVSNYFAGEIGQPTGAGKLAADMIGTGDVRVSPLGMALAASVVDSGGWHSPSLVTGLADSSSTPRASTSPEVLSELRALMHAASGHLWLSWFVGYQGNVAFAAVELGKSPSAAASALAGSFLQNVRAGS